MAETRASFNFHRDFATPADASFVDPHFQPPVAFAEHRRHIEAAASEAYARGCDDGRQQQADEESAAMAQVLGHMAQQLQHAASEMRGVEERARREALSFARLFARKLAGKVIERAPVGAIEATARAIFSDLRGTPHVAIRVTPPLVDPCKNRITLLMKEMGIEAKLFVFPDPDIALGDCRIEWADGGIVRDQDKLSALIDQALNVVLEHQMPAGESF